MSNIGSYACGRRARSLAIAVACLAAASTAQAQVSPVGAHHTTVGPGGGLDSPVSPTGGYIASVPLDLPKPRGPLPVPLSIVYTGSRRGGAAGQSWDVPFGYVRRSRGNWRRKPEAGDVGVNTYVERIYVSTGGGAQLMVPNGNVYVPFTSGEYQELRDDGGVWRLRTLGNIEYTFSPASTIDRGQGVDDYDLWLLSEIRDLTGTDKVTLTYETFGDDKEPTLTKIAYGYHLEDEKLPLYEIELAYDRVQGFDSIVDDHLTFTRHRRLMAVRIHARNNLDKKADPKVIRSYHLAYTTDFDTQRPLLASVSIGGEEGTTGSVLPVARYTYGQLTFGGASPEPSLQYGPSVPVGRPNTLTADQVGDIATSEVTTDRYVSPGTNNAWIKARVETTKVRHLLRDFTGDGVADLLFAKDGKWWLYPSKPATYGVSFSSSPLMQWDSSNGPAELSVQRTFRFEESTIAQDSATFARDAMVTTETWTQFVDWDGDGRIDVIDVNGGQDPNYWKVWLNRASSTQPIFWRPVQIRIGAAKAALAARGFRRDNFIQYFPQLGWEDRLPIERSRSWPRTENQTCDRYTCGYVGGGGPWQCNPDTTLSCSADASFERVWATDTITDWKLADYNGDGFGDLISAGGPVHYCKKGWSEGNVPQCTAGPISEDPNDPNATYFCKNYRKQWIWAGGDSACNEPTHDPNLVYLNRMGPFTGMGLDAFGSTPIAAAYTSEFGVGHWTSGTDDNLELDGVLPNYQQEGGLSWQTAGYGDRDATGKLGWGESLTYVSAPDAFNTNRHLNCKEGSSATTPIISRQDNAEVDIDGDGLIDVVYKDAATSRWMVSINRAAGYTVPRRIDSPNLAFAVSETSGTCGGNAHNVAGLIDLDGDGKPELVRVVSGQLYMSQLVPSQAENLHAVGRLISVDNGYGAITRITYSNAKLEHETAHVPSPEIVMRKLTTEITDGSAPSLQPTYFGYGTAEQEYDPFAGHWVFSGYRRHLVLSGVSLRGSTVNGILSISQFTASALPGASFEEHATAHRAYKQSSQEGLFSLGTLRYPDTAGGAPFAESTTTSSARKLTLPAWNAYSPIECSDLDAFYGTAVGFSRCNAAGIVYTLSNEAWQGMEGPPSLRNSLTRDAVEEVDDFGRRTRWRDEGDARRTDDDVCTTVTYADPVGGGVFPSLPRSMVLTDCGWDEGEHGKPGTPRILAATHLAYDDLPVGQVGRGLMTARYVDRYDDTGYLDTKQVVAATYDSAGMIETLTSSRTLGSAATKATTYQRDGFGFSLIKVEEIASDVDQVLSREANVSTWSTEPAWAKDTNGIITWTDREGFGRVARQRVTGGLGGPKTTVIRFTYQDWGARSVTKEVFPVDTTPGAEDSAVEVHRSVTVLDALGRERFTQGYLGADYGDATVVSGVVEYDTLGRPTFAAVPFPWSSAPFSPSQVQQPLYGVTSSYDRQNRLVRSVEAHGRSGAFQTDPANDTYVTSIQYGWLDGLSLVSTQGPSENASGTSDALHHDDVWRTARGREVERSRLNSNGERIDLVRKTWDRLGRIVSTRRFVDPATGNVSVDWNNRFDSLGNLLSMTEPGMSTHYTDYDEDGNPIESWWQDGLIRHITRTRYDGFGRVTEQSLIRSLSGAEEIENTDRFAYDRLSGDPSQPASDVSGRLSWIETDGVGSVFFAYDSFGRTSSTSYRYRDNDQLVRQSATYTAPGRLTSLLLETPTTSDIVAYDHDSAGRVRTVYDGNNYEYWSAPSLEFDGFAPLVLFGNGTSAGYNRAPDGRRELESWGVQTQQGNYSFEQSYDAAGRIATETLSTPWSTDQRGYWYDALGRLNNTVQLGGGWPGVERYEHDPLGNLVSRNATTGAGDREYEPDPADPDRLCRYATPGTSGPCDFVYDGAGNVVTDATQQDARSFEYDSGSRIKKIKRGHYTAQLLYGPAGRARTSIAGQEKRIYWHFGSLIEERTRSGGGRQVERRIPGPTGIFATLRSDGTRDTIVYEHGDGRAPRVFTDETGQVVQAPTYRTYGEVTQNGGNDPMTSTDDLWNGGDDIPELGVVLLGPRAYDPDLGRFLQRDPVSITSRASLANPYAFSFSDPVNYADPSGLSPFGWIEFLGLVPTDGAGDNGSVGGGGGGWFATALAVGIGTAMSSFGGPHIRHGNFRANIDMVPGGPVTGPGKRLNARAWKYGLDPGPDFDWDSVAGGSYENLDSKLGQVVEVMTMNGQIVESRLPRWAQRELVASVAWWDGMSFGLGPVARDLAGYSDEIDMSSGNYRWGSAVAFGTTMGVTFGAAAPLPEATVVGEACAGGACGGPKCFVAGTPVRVGDTEVQIENAVIGQRVPNDHAACHETSFADWVSVHLSMEGAEGDRIDVTLLRNEAWLLSSKAVPGATIWLALDELRVEGPALIISIDKSINVDEGRGCPITGTIRHYATSLQQLRVDTSDVVIDVTPTHPFYSVDRDGWISAGDLRVGEHIASERGVATVTANAGRSTPPIAVYNLEVYAAHEYFVHERALLVHNQCAPGAAAEMRAYGGPGGGHHPLAKSAFVDAQGYHPNTALAIPNEELARLGVSHSAITGAQSTAYRAFAQTGAPLTWEAMETIETNALVRGGMSRDMASATVARAIEHLKDMGVAGPTRIPWSR